MISRVAFRNLMKKFFFVLPTCRSHGPMDDRSRSMPFWRNNFSSSSSLFLYCYWQLHRRTYKRHQAQKCEPFLSSYAVLSFSLYNITPAVTRNCRCSCSFWPENDITGEERERERDTKSKRSILVLVLAPSSTTQSIDLLVIIVWNCLFFFFLTHFYTYAWSGSFIFVIVAYFTNA